jgi:hypothetical protein
MTCEICNKGHDSINHFQETTPFDIIIKEAEPLDIILQEVNNNIKDSNVGGPNDVDEGGLGSGRHPETPGDSGGGQPGPLMTFETVRPLNIIKEVMDAKLKCPCSQK